MIEARALEGVIATAGVVVIERDRVLLVEHGDGAGHVTGAWGIPAGGIDAGETPRDAAVRELAEETGLRVDVDALVPIPTVYEAQIQRKIGSARFTLHAFATDRYNGNVTGSDEGRPRWVHLREVDDLSPLLPNMVAIIEAAVHVLRR